MATKLKNLKITKVDFVDEGANPDADIMLFKRKDGAEVPTEDRDRRGVLKQLKELFEATFAAVENPEGEEPVGKGGASTFDTELARGKAMEELWDMHYALADSICSIICDAELDSTAKQEAMEQSVEEFTATIKEAIKSWTVGQPSGFVVKMDGEALSPVMVEAMKSTRDRLSDIITKSAAAAGEEPDKTTITEGDKDMKFDKSKMTPAEKAMLEQLEKNYGIEDEAAGEGTQQPEGGIEKKLDTTPETTPATQQKAEIPAAAPAAQTDDGDIFKNLDPAVKAKIEAVEKFKQDAEDRELHEIAKGYAIIGKKDEDLFPVLKSLKATSQSAYESMISALDSAKAAVEQSGVFSEIGKSGNGTTAQGGAVKEVETKAAELMKSKSGLTMAQAIDAVLMGDPELAKRYETEEE